MRRTVFTSILILLYAISSAQGVKVTIDFKDLDFEDVSRDKIYVSGKSHLMKSIGNIESVTVVVDDLPNYIDLMEMGKRGKLTTLKRIWVEEETISIKGKIRDIVIEPNYPYQIEVERQVDQFKVEKKFDTTTTISKGYLIYIKRRKDSYSVDYIEELLSNIPDSLQEFWVVKDLNRYILDFNRVSYNSMNKKFNYLIATDRDSVKTRIEPNGDKYILLDFSTIGCIPCLLGIEHLVEIDKKYRDKLEIVMLWNEFSYKGWMSYTPKYLSKITFTHLLDESGVIFKAFDPKTYPTYLLFDKSGTLIKKWSGKLPKNFDKYLE